MGRYAETVAHFFRKGDKKANSISLNDSTQERQEGHKLRTPRAMSIQRIVLLLLYVFRTSGCSSVQFNKSANRIELVCFYVIVSLDSTCVYYVLRSYYTARCLLETENLPLSYSILRISYYVVFFVVKAMQRREWFEMFYTLQLSFVLLSNSWV